MSNTAYNKLPTVEVLYDQFSNETYVPRVYGTTCRTFTPNLVKPLPPIEYKETTPTITSDFKLDPLFLVRT